LSKILIEVEVGVSRENVVFSREVGSESYGAIQGGGIVILQFNQRSSFNLTALDLWTTHFGPL